MLRVFGNRVVCRSGELPTNINADNWLDDTAFILAVARGGATRSDIESSESNNEIRHTRKCDGIFFGGGISAPTTTETVLLCGRLPRVH